MASFCPSCGSAVDAGAHFCASCGSALAATCPACGRAAPVGASFCPNCGERLTHMAEEAGEAERKIISAVFVDLVGFTADSAAADPEDVGERLAAYHEAVRREIERYEGRVEKLIGDGVFAVFGVPAVHEDDAERAVRSSLRLLEAVERLNEQRPDLGLSVRIAVTTGEALVRSDPGLSEEGVVGDVVNTASRLQAEAPIGTTVVEQRTYLLTRHAIDYRVLDPVVVKGKSEPVALWQAIQARSSYGVGVERDPTTPFVGRERDLRLLEDTVDRMLQTASVQLVTVSGEAGAGKTRLVAEFHQRLDDRQEIFLWRQGRNLPFGEGVSFWALAEVVKAQAGILENEPPDQAQQKLQSALAALIESEQERRWLESRLMPLIGAGGDLAGAERAELFSAWLRFLEALAQEHPLILMFEDLHWADRPLIEFVKHLVERAAESPILVLCTARPELYSDHSDWGSGMRNAVSIALPPLSTEETSELVAALGGVEDARTVQVLAERSAGNPLYATEFVRMLRDSGSQEAGDLFPESIHGLIAARIDLLSAEDKALLQTAAVVGKVFWTGALAFAARLDPGPVSERLGAIAGRELIRRVRRPSMQGQEEWAFGHDLVRDVAYGQLPRGRRGALHVGVAEWIEAAAADRLEELSEVLAHHYWTAHELAEAAGHLSDDLARQTVRFLTLSGKRLIYLDALKARDYLDRALLLDVAAAERAPAMSLMGEAAWLLGEYDLAEKRLEEAIGAAREVGDTELEVETLNRYSALKWVRGERDAADEAGGRAVALARRLEPSALVARTLASEAASKWLRGAISDETALAEEALALARQVGDLDAELRALTAIAGFRLARGDQSGLDVHREVLRRALEAGSPRAGSAYNNVGTELLNIQDGPPESIGLMQDAIEWCHRRGFEAGADWSRLTLVEALLQTEDWSDVDAILADVTSRYGSDTLIGVMSRKRQAEVALHRGDLLSARNLVDEALPAARTAKDDQTVLPGLAISCLVHASLGDLTETARLIAEWEEVAQTPRYRTRWLPSMAEAMISSKHEEALGRALALPPAGEPLHVAAFAEAEAILLEARGDAAAAGRYEEAAEGYARIYYLRRGYALAGVARTRSARGDPGAREAAEQAREIAETLGAERLRGQIPGLS